MNQHQMSYADQVRSLRSIIIKQSKVESHVRVNVRLTLARCWLFCMTDSFLPREHLSACLEANGLYRGYFKLQAAIARNVTARGF